MYPIDTFAQPAAVLIVGAAGAVATAHAARRHRAARRAWRSLATVDGRAALYTIAATARRGR